MNYNPKKASSNHISIKISSTLFKELNQLYIKLVFSQRLRNFPLPFIHTTSMVAVSQYVTYSNTWQRSATEYSRVTFSICNHMTARKNNIFIVHVV